MNNYVSCGYRRIYIMWDLDNGHAWSKRDNGKGYVWIFQNYKDAMQHRRKQHKNKRYAGLSMPIRIDGRK